MLILLSPAKNIDLKGHVDHLPLSTPLYLDRAEYLIGKLKKKSPAQLQKLMKISPDLAGLNHERYQHWTPTIDQEGSTQAALLFNGEVYRGLNAKDWSAEDFDWAQEHLRILSGLYGVLRPADATRPYRLEMGTRMEVTPKKTDLYKYWNGTIRAHLQEVLDAQGSDVILDLASAEYSKAAQLKQMGARIITPSFKDLSKGEYRMLMVFAKKARGMMADHVVRNRITSVEDLKTFDREGYAYNEALSEGDQWVYTRDERP